MSASSSPVIGKIGQALGFNGVSSFIRYGPNASAFKFGMGSFSISAWVKPVNETGTSLPNPAIFGVRVNITSSRYGLNLDYSDTPGSNKIQAYIEDDNGNTQTQHTTQTLPNNQWSYVTMVVNRSNNTLNVYINGAPTSISNVNISNLTGTISPQESAYTELL